jgi:hypothetical protein
MDDYELMQQAEETGRLAWEGDLKRRFDYDKRPKNPHSKDDICHEWWWVGYTDAMVIWFNDGIDPNEEG